MSHDTEKKFFNLHISGLGFLERAREVTPKRGQAFLAVAVNALFGASDAVQRTRFDCRVVGREAEEIVRRHMEAINDTGSKVLCGFRLGDLYAETFTYEKGKWAGETGVSLKARLLRLDWVKIDGEMVHQRERLAEEETPDAKEASMPDAGTPSETNTDTPASGEVRLSKDDPDFEAKKALLKKQGYRFDFKAKVWRLPQAAA